MYLSAVSKGTCAAQEMQTMQPSVSSSWLSGSPGVYLGLGVLLRVGLDVLEFLQQGEEHRVGEHVALDSFVSGEVLGS